MEAIGINVYQRHYQIVILDDDATADVTTECRIPTDRDELEVFAGEHAGAGGRWRPPGTTGSCTTASTRISRSRLRTPGKPGW